MEYAILVADAVSDRASDVHGQHGNATIPAPMPGLEAIPCELKEGYRLFVFRPSVFAIKPGNAPWYPFFFYWALHQARVFATREYCVFCIFFNGVLVHRTAVMPRFFRFPFVGDNALEVGPVWTDPAHRGMGLASEVLRTIRNRFSHRRLWYVVRENNPTSIRVAESIGFVRAGTCVRTRRFGLKVLGAFELKPDEAGGKRTSTGVEG